MATSPSTRLALGTGGSILKPPTPGDREQLKVDRPLSLRAPTNEIAHRVAKSQKEIGLPPCAVLAGWASSPGASRQAWGISHLLQADSVTASAFIARWPSTAWRPVLRRQA